MKNVMATSILCIAFLIGGLMSGAFAWEKDTNRPGHDYKVVNVYSLEECVNQCKLEQQCKSFTAEIPWNLQQSGGAGKCHLKDAVPPPVSDKCCVSGLKSTALPTLPTPIPTPIPSLQKGQVIKKDTQTSEEASASEIRKCPDQITIKGIEIQSTQYLNVPPGFLALPVGSEPATFHVFRTGKLSNTVCYCEYEIGDLLVQLRADLTGYKSCDAGMNNKILLFK